MGNGAIEVKSAKTTAHFYMSVYWLHLVKLKRGICVNFFTATQVYNTTSLRVSEVWHVVFVMVEDSTLSMTFSRLSTIGELFRSVSSRGGVPRALIKTILPLEASVVVKYYFESLKE